MNNYVETGNTFNFTAGAAYSAGDFVFSGGLVGVCVNDVENGAVGVANRTGVYYKAKAAVTIAQGDKLYWDSGSSVVTNVANAYPVGAAHSAAASSATYVDVLLISDVAELSAAEVRDLLETLTTTSRLDADSVKEGSTNLFLTSSERSNIADAFLVSSDDSDDISEGSTNLFMTSAERTKVGDILCSSIAAAAYTATGDDDTANLATIDLGTGVAPVALSVMILRAGVDVKEDAVITILGGADLGKVTVGDGAATYDVTSGDIIHVIGVVPAS